MRYGYGQMSEYTQQTLALPTPEEAQAVVDGALEWHTRHGHTIVSSGIEETADGFVGVVVYQMEGERAKVTLEDDREIERQEQLGPGEPVPTEQKSRTGLYVGLGLGALALAGIGYVVVRSRKRR